MTVRALEFYSGIGGLHSAFSRSKVDGSVVASFDWDQNACQVYAVNYDPKIIKKVDISTLAASDLASLRANLWLLSPACQPYTVLNPKAKGALDPRAQSFLHLIQNILPELTTLNALPSHLLMENVAGFEVHSTSTTRQIALSMLKSLGYIVIELLLTPLQFGMPNSRLRYYVLAKKAPLKFANVSNEDSKRVWRHIPGSGNDWIDHRVECLHKLDTDSSNLDSCSPARPLQDYLDSESRNVYAIPDKVLAKWGRLFDIVLPSSHRSCCFTRGYTQLVERAGSILQMNTSLDTATIFDEFQNAQKEKRSDALDILRPLHLRYFSPDELLRIFDFNPVDMSTDWNFKWPSSITVKTKYKLIGNSVNVRVIQMLIDYLYEE
ncbi:S-adenosyl-L-methionine-dependent methyltransferase [Cyathus striatus]|nr:S-adenosyl-L-methionine-dependent methyltransferase [Cyathus striatus]